MDGASSAPPLPPDVAEPAPPLPSELDAPPLPPLPLDDAPEVNPPEQPPLPAEHTPAAPADARSTADHGAGAAAAHGASGAAGISNGVHEDMLTADLDPEEDPLLVAEARRAAEAAEADAPAAEEPMWPEEDPDAVKLSAAEEDALLKVRSPELSRG